jgi:hypothetical protein
MVCLYCGGVFCWDDADTTVLGGGQKLYCSERCGRLRYKHRRRGWARVCNKQAKGTYPTERSALQAVASLWEQKRVKRWSYRCPGCRKWHLTSTPTGYRVAEIAVIREVAG